ncbi:MAG: DUF721 domain-containing protein [Varibaculum timonense]
MGANQPEPGLTYTQQAIRAAQEHAFSKGLVRMSNEELRRFRGRRNWDGIVAQSVGKDEAQTVSAEISLGQVKGVNDSYARDKVPGLAGLQPSPGLAGGGHGGRWSRRDPRPLGMVWKKYVRQFGLNAQLDAGKLKADWAKIVGVQVAQHAHIESIKDGDVVLRCDSTRWASELRNLIPQLMGLIEDYSGSVVIKRLIILGPKAPSWKHGPRSVKGRGPRDTYG